MPLEFDCNIAVSQPIDNVDKTNRSSDSTRFTANVDSIDSTEVDFSGRGPSNIDRRSVCVCIDRVATIIFDCHRITGVIPDSPVLAPV